MPSGITPRTYQNPIYPYRRCPDQDAARPVVHPVVVVGAGPVGLTAALDLERYGIDVVLIDDSDTVSVGSRAICFAKRTLEIWDRLGVGERMVDKGVLWKTGRVYFGDEEVYNFDLLPEEGHKMPAFINLQQYYAEQYLVEALEEEGADVRWRHELVALKQEPEHVNLTIETPEGRYSLLAQYVIGADGVRSSVRELLSLPFPGQVFEDHFLIADIHMKAGFPAERRFWFDPPFNKGQSALLHMQPDDVWRVDLQLGSGIDLEKELDPPRVRERVRSMLGDLDFDLEWVSIYKFNCRRMDQFRHGRVFFAGDAAHQVSPFGARGANSGIQDVDNLVWKLVWVLRGDASEELLDTYDEERIPAADENLRHSTDSTEFISPPDEASRKKRDEILERAKTDPLARPLVNSGRLSTPFCYSLSSLTSSALEDGACVPPGGACVDAPVRVDGKPRWLLELLGGRFCSLPAGPGADPEGELPDVLVGAGTRVETIRLDAGQESCFEERYPAGRRPVLVVRPDQHLL